MTGVEIYSSVSIQHGDYNMFQELHGKGVWGQKTCIRGKSAVGVLGCIEGFLVGQSDVPTVVVYACASCFIMYVGIRILVWLVLR